MRYLLSMLVLGSLAVAQTPPSQPPAADLRLTYELPVDALQRAIRGNPNVQLEKVLAHSVDVLTRRLAGIAKVHRLDASRLAVDVTEADEADVRRVRQLAERNGALRMSIVADPADDAGRGDDTLQASREKLQQWLVDGGLARVLENPANLAAFGAGDDSRIVWLPRRIHRDGKRWQFSMAQNPDGEAACVPLYDADQWNGGNVPAAMIADDDACLLELVAVDLSRGGFENEHIDSDRVSEAPGRRGRSSVLYQIVPDQQQRYSDWSHDNVGRMSAIILDGDVIATPKFVARIPGGRGLIDMPSERAASSLATALRTGPFLLPPKLVASGPIPADK